MGVCTGAIWVDGLRSGRDNQAIRTTVRVGYVPQGNSLLPRLTPEEHLTLITDGAAQKWYICPRAAGT